MSLSKAFLGSQVDDASGTTLTVSGLDTSPYTHLAVFAKHEGAPTTIDGSDNKGSGTYNGLTKVDHSNNDLSARIVWVKLGTPGTSTNVSSTLGAARPYRRMAVWGVNASSGNIALDVEATNQGNGTAVDAGTLATSAGTVSFMGTGEYTHVSFLPGTGWTEDLDNLIHGQSRADVSSGTFDPACTSSIAMDWVACAASFKEVVSGIEFAASLNLTLTSAAALSTQITLASAVSVTVTSAAALSTQITMAAAVTCRITVAAPLTTSITMASAVTCRITVTAPLTTAIAMASALTMAMTSTAALSTQIALASAVALALTAAGELSGGAAQFASAIGVSIVVAGALSTGIRMAVTVPVTITVIADLTIPIVMATSVSITVTASGTLVVEILMPARVLLARIRRFIVPAVGRTFVIPACRRTYVLRAQRG